MPRCPATGYFIFVDLWSLTHWLNHYSSNRSGYLQYAYENELEGLKTGHFEVPLELFANATINPDNIGFCYPDENSCHPTGLLNAESCKSGKKM